MYFFLKSLDTISSEFIEVKNINIKFRFQKYTVDCTAIVFNEHKHSDLVRIWKII